MMTDRRGSTREKSVAASLRAKGRGKRGKEEKEEEDERK
jgi:hypothetical protein